MTIQDKTASGYAARAAAASLISGVLVDHRMLIDQAADPDGPLARLAPPDRARAQSITTGVLRNLGPLDTVLDPHLDHAPPLRARNALRIAAWEMLCDGVPAHAAVDMAVALARAGRKTSNLAGMVNAVGRKIAGAGDHVATAPVQPLPKALRTPLIKAYGATRTTAIEAAHRPTPPVDLTLKSPADGDEWAASLGARRLPTGSLRLDRPGQISALPGFEAGAWWVQDAAAAVPARLLDGLAGASVLDLCAAPGGKTLQLAAAGAMVTALDASARRLVRLRENLARTGLAADLVTADATRWVPDRKFDAILLDAPCSATGTIRRHPDLPHLRDNADLRPLFALQETLLSRALDWLRPGGRLVYCTCSLFPREGEMQIAKLADRADIIAIDPAAQQIPESWISPEGFFRTTPEFWGDIGGVDGFFAAVLTR